MEPQNPNNPEQPVNNVNNLATNAVPPQPSVPPATPQQPVNPAASEAPAPVTPAGAVVTPQMTAPVAPSLPPSELPSNTPAPLVPDANVQPQTGYSPYGAAPGVVVGGGGLMSDAPTSASSNDGGMSMSPVVGGGRSKKPLVFGLLAAVVLIGGAAAFYFGYYNNPSVVYSQSLGNTGKGYNKLIDYIDKQSTAKYKGYTASGTYKVDSGSFTTDGKLNLKGDDKKSQLTFDVGLGTTRLNADVRTIKTTGNTPDIYFKATGIKGLGSSIGTPALDNLEGKWVVIDHSLIDNLEKSAASQSGTDLASAAPTRAQVLDEMKAFGKVNQQYVFTTNQNQAVTKVVKKYGAETVDGHKTYHYQVALVKDNVKKYVTAQRDALKASQLNDWIKKNKYDQNVDDAYKSLEKSADGIKSSDTFDVWMDMSHRVVYKVRVADKGQAANYADFGLDYKGGSQYPFFLSGQSKDGGGNSTGSLYATVDTKTNSIGFKFKLRSSGTYSANAQADLTFKPTNSDAATAVAIPANAEQLSQVLNELGLGDILSGDLLSGQQSTATDSKRQTDIQALQTQLEANFQENGNYPSLGQLNDANWRKANMSTLDDNALTDPEGTSKTLVAAPAAKVYAYQVTNDQGASCEAQPTSCSKYTLTATLSTGKTYTKNNLD